MTPEEKAMQDIEMIQSMLAKHVDDALKKFGKRRVEDALLMFVKSFEKIKYNKSKRSN